MKKKPTKKESQNVQALLKTGEQKTVFMPKWEDHVRNNSSIKSFSTIVKDQLYHVMPKEDEIFLPYAEYMGDHTMCWILGIDIKTGEEFLRKNVRHVDMIDWKLSSSEINPSTDEK